MATQGVGLVGSSDFRENLVRIAREQLAEFGGLDESHPKLRAQIEKYWRGIGLRFPGEEVAWSAVFVSWCMKQAGATKSEFKFSESHSVYVKEAIRNADLGTGVFRAVPIDREPVAVGDLIHVNRDARPGVPGTTTYAQARNTTGYSSHCDIVVGLRPGAAEVIGGNLSDTRAMKTVALTPGGFVKQRSSNPYISVVKNLKQNGMAAEAEEEDLMATVIKIKDPNEHQLWLYAGGQRRKLTRLEEVDELRRAKVLDNKTIELSRETLNAIPIMPGATN